MQKQNNITTTLTIIILSLLVATQSYVNLNMNFILVWQNCGYLLQKCIWWIHSVVQVFTHMSKLRQINLGLNIMLMEEVL